MFLDKNNKILEYFKKFIFLTIFLHNNKYILLEKMLKKLCEKSFYCLDIGSGFLSFIGNLIINLILTIWNRKKFKFFNTCKKNYL